VGRLDPRVDRKTARLILQSIYLEEGIDPEEGLVEGIVRTIRSFMDFHQADGFEIIRSQPPDLKQKIETHL
jgi:uncharacterized protein YcaQ